MRFASSLRAVTMITGTSPPPAGAADLVAVHAREHQVEQHEVDAPRRTCSIASSPLGASATVNPASVRYMRSRRRMARSSSTTRTCPRLATLAMIVPAPPRLNRQWGPYRCRPSARRRARRDSSVGRAHD